MNFTDRNRMCAYLITEMRALCPWLPPYVCATLALQFMDNAGV